MCLRSDGCDVRARRRTAFLAAPLGGGARSRFDALLLATGSSQSPSHKKSPATADATVGLFRSDGPDATGLTRPYRDPPLTRIVCYYIKSTQPLTRGFFAKVLFSEPPRTGGSPGWRTPTQTKPARWRASSVRPCGAAGERAAQNRARYLPFTSPSK